MKEKINSILTIAKEKLNSANEMQALEDLRVKYLGKKGELTGLLKQLGSLSAEERPKVGQLVNQTKQE